MANNKSLVLATIDILISVVHASLFKKHISVSAQLRKMKMAMAREIEQEKGSTTFKTLNKVLCSYCGGVLFKRTKETCQPDN